MTGVPATLRTTLRAPLRALALTTLATAGGCDSAAVHLAQEAADRQAEQNRTMAALEREVAAGSRQLVEEQGRARRAALALQRDLNADRAQIADERTALERERQAIARERRSESFWAAVLPASGGGAAAAVALAVAGLALWAARRDDDSAVVACQLLVERLDDDGPDGGLDAASPAPPPFDAPRLVDPRGLCDRLPPPDPENP